LIILTSGISVDKTLKALLCKVYSVSKGCRETVLCLCCTLGKAVHERLIYPQACYPQTPTPTYAMG
ncbi:hypothetical protein, partial [Pseudomonas viridiflava]|uniref:hypothetical protein n=1 Tax=Pseudomonas viridiflava TaxID=33069 RepID=UPI00197D770A